MNERDVTDTDTGSEAPPALGGPRSCESRALQAGMRASAARKACVCHPVQCDALRGTHAYVTDCPNDARVGTAEDIMMMLAPLGCIAGARGIQLSGDKSSLETGTLAIAGSPPMER